jgi:hypothetical protein
MTVCDHHESFIEVAIHKVMTACSKIYTKEDDPLPRYDEAKKKYMG